MTSTRLRNSGQESPIPIRNRRMKYSWPNKITGPNAGGPRQFPPRAPLPARVGQFWRYAAGKARLIKRQLFDLAAALSEAPGRYVACQITARVRAAPSEH